MKFVDAILKGRSWNNPMVLSALVIFCLVVGFGAYYMLMVDAKDATVDSGWFWFLLAALVFIGLELYFGPGKSGDQRPMDNDADDEHPRL